MIKVADIAWLAGLLEGEGCFRLNHGKYPVIVVTMTDEDVIIKAKNIWKSNTRVYHYKNLWRTEVSGAHAVSWMMSLYPFLCERRREKVIKIIKFWQTYPYIRAHNGLQIKASCHPDRPARSFGLCKSCYQKQWYKRKKLLSGKILSRAPNGSRFPAFCHPDRLAIGPDRLCNVCYDRQRYIRRKKVKLLEKVG